MISSQSLNPGLATGDIDRSSPYPTTTVDQQTLMDGLNDDLAGEFRAILRYTSFAAQIAGPFRRELRALFLAEVADKLRHAQFLADNIVSLGGEPTTEPRPAPHADQPREMLEQMLHAERQAMTDSIARSRQAEAFGDIGLKFSLESKIAEETRHMREIERILAGWTEWHTPVSPLTRMSG